MFRIDPEFKKLIPALAGDEYSQLEANIVADGCRDPLTVWEEEGLLLDGHNRFEICKRYGIEHETAYVSLDSRQHAINWIINNQLGRRNVTPEQASYLRGKRYNMEKAQGSRTDLTSDHFDRKLGATDARLADEFKMSAPTIRRDGKYAVDVDTLSDAIGDEARTTVLSGDSKVTKQDVADAAEWYRSNPTKQATQPIGTVRLQPTPAPILIAAKPPMTTRDASPVIPTTEEEILEAARRIQREREAEKKEIVEKRKQEAKAAERATIEVAPLVYQTDCVTFLENYHDNHFDMLFTDPPYATDVDDIDAFVNRWVPVALRKVKSEGRAYICTGAYPEEMNAYLKVLLGQNKFIVDAPIIWTYRNTLGVTPKMKYNLNYQLVWHLYSNKSRELDTSITNEMFSVQDINAPDGRMFNRFHTWQKPDELARRLITHATQPGDLIADPFVCTGTFVLMASRLKRDAVGADLSADNLSIAKERGCNVIFE